MTDNRTQHGTARRKAARPRCAPVYPRSERSGIRALDRGEIFPRKPAASRRRQQRRLGPEGSTASRTSWCPAAPVRASIRGIEEGKAEGEGEMDSRAGNGVAASRGRRETTLGEEHGQGRHEKRKY
eukprot:5821115-Pleurochrysis_carterae.AAC.1